MTIIECKNCGHSLTPTARICSKCGTVKTKSNINLVWACAAAWLALGGVILRSALL